MEASYYLGWVRPAGLACAVAHFLQPPHKYRRIPEQQRAAREKVLEAVAGD